MLPYSRNGFLCGNFEYFTRLSMNEYENITVALSIIRNCEATGICMGYMPQSPVSIPINIMRKSCIISPAITTPSLRRSIREDRPFTIDIRSSYCIFGQGSFSYFLIFQWQYDPLAFGAKEEYTISQKIKYHPLWDKSPLLYHYKTTITPNTENIASIFRFSDPDATYHITTKHLMIHAQFAYNIWLHQDFFINGEREWKIKSFKSCQSRQAISSLDVLTTL